MASKRKKENKKGSKGAGQVTVTKHNYTGKLSLVIPLYNESSRFDLMAQSLDNFAKLWSTPYEVILVNDGSADDTLQKLTERYSDASTEAVTYHVVDLGQNQGKGAALKAGVAASTGDHILTLDADMAADPKYLFQWLRQLEGNTFSDNQILIASREHKDSNVTTEDWGKRRFLGKSFNLLIQLLTGASWMDTQCGFKLYPTAIAKPLFEAMTTAGWAHDVELLDKAHLYGVEVIEMPIKWQEVDGSKISVWSDGFKMGATSLWINLKNRSKYFFVEPFKYRNNTTVLGQPQKESPLYRFLFAMLSILLLFVMPYLSFSYGVTADEGVQQDYGVHVYDYFQSNGVDGDALTYKNLYLYGGMFDYWMVCMQRHVFTSWDIYEVRHMFNALTGVLLMIFTGLLGKVLSQRWQIAFWSLIFVVLSPRVFGHAMNNPKDIPFATGYTLTLLFILNFVRQLPKPTLSSMLGIIVGLMLTINVRVGGILLIPYLFLFTGGSFVLEKHLRPYLKQFGYLFKLGIILGVIVLIGYWGGLLYWPFAREDKINAPLTALAEMSNFAIGIRMIWEGQHYWSDGLPWYYLSKWLLISTPLVVLIGTVLGVLPVFKDARNKWILAMAAFAGFFPMLYVIYKDSALYDGMRHFLFVCPIFVAIAAYGWVTLMDMVQNKNAKMGVTAVVVVLLALPARWMVISHPHQYMYFNELVGGIQGAYGDYETDYWMNSTKEACEWFVENIPEMKTGEEIVVGTQAILSVGHYLNKYPNIRVIYTRYNERAKGNWDYGIYISRFVNQGYLKKGLWPLGTDILYTREVDGVPICSISKRGKTNKKSVTAISGITNAAKAQQEAAKGNDPQLKTQAAQAYQKSFLDAFGLLKEVIADDPRDESARFYLAQYQIQAGKYEEAKVTLDSLLSLSGSYSNTLGLMAVAHLNTQNVAKAKEYFQRAVEANLKYVFGHYHLARIAASEQKLQEAIQHLEKFDRYGGQPAQGYDLGLQIANQLQNDVLKTFFTAKKLSFKGDWQGVMGQLNACLAIDPTYAPALRMKKSIDDSIAKQTRANERQVRLKREGKIK